MLKLLRDKKPLRFLLISTLLSGAAVGAGLVAAVAGHAGAVQLASISSKAALALSVVIVLYAVPRVLRSLRWRSEYAMHVTNGGLIFSAAILVVTILALSSGNNLLYLVLAALLATMIVSVLAGRLNLARLEPAARYPDHIFAGEPVHFEVTLHSGKRLLPSFSLSVDLVEELADERKSAGLGYFPALPARASARMRTERCFDKRGVHAVAGFVISTGFPFGFIEQRRFIEWRSEVVVYPQPQPLDDFLPLLTFAQGRIESRAKGSGSDLYAIRPYLSSDHHHHIDWKATAKTGRLMVRQFTRDDDWRVTVNFDSGVDDERAAAAEFDEMFERAIRFAASLVTHFIEMGAEVRLVTANEGSGFGLSQSHRFGHRFLMLRRLAQISPQLLSSESANENGQRPSRSGEQAGGLEILITSNGHRGGAQSPAASMSAVRHVISFEELL